MSEHREQIQREPHEPGWEPGPEDRRYAEQAIREQTQSSSVVPMLPTFPKVRCDNCRRAYQLSDDQLGAAFINGECPFCGHDRFSTVMAPSGVIVHESFHGPSAA